jgi:hypothetical protein
MLPVAQLAGGQRPLGPLQSSGSACTRFPAVGDWGSFNATAKGSLKISMKTYKFKARIESATVGDGGACVYFPYDVEQEFGTKGRVPVKATFDGVPYTGSLVKYGAPQHMLGILKAVREQLGKGPGDMVDVTIQRDETERKVDIPVELEKLLKKEKLTELFAGLSYTHQKEYCRWITEARREETRANRLAKTAEMLKSGVKTPG